MGCAFGFSGSSVRATPLSPAPGASPGAVLPALTAHLSVTPVDLSLGGTLFMGHIEKGLGKSDLRSFQYTLAKYGSKKKFKIVSKIRKLQRRNA